MKVLITGARSGIGYKTGIDLEKIGYEVILAVHTEEESKKLKNKLLKMNSSISVIKLDITNDEDLNKINDLNIDILINNASVGYGGSLLSMDTNLILENFKTNVMGTLKLSRKFLSDLYLKKRIGTVVFIGSLAGTIPISFIGSYSITKAAIQMISKILKKEIKLIGMDTKVKLIEPGIYNTGFNDFIFDFLDNNYSIKRKKIFRLIGKNKLKGVSNTIIKSISTSNHKLIYRTSIMDSILIKMYNLFFS